MRMVSKEDFFGANNTFFYNVYYFLSFYILAIHQSILVDSLFLLREYCQRVQVSAELAGNKQLRPLGKVKWKLQIITFSHRGS